jgi:nicotinate phosphoribosyltransferase
VRRYRDGARFVADAIFDREHAPKAGTTIVDPMDPTRQTLLSDALAFEDLLQPTMRDGKRVAADVPLADIRARAKTQRDSLHPSVRRFLHAHEYPVGLDLTLHAEKTRMILAARGAR